MPSKSEIKLFSKLLQKKFRETEHKFIAEGKRLISEGLNSKIICEKILVTSEFLEKETDYLKFLEKLDSNISVIPKRDFSKITSTENSQGIIAIFQKPKISEVKKNDKTIICLENISDPGNVGTILRTCDWFGIKTVLLSKNCAELYNPKVIRASMGAIFHLNIIENVDLYAEIKKLKAQNYKALFADLNGNDYRKINFNEKHLITFCSEAFGPTDDLKKVCDSAITIPKKGSIDSLNVAAAAAVILSAV